MLSEAIIEDLLKDSPCFKNGLCGDDEGHWCFLRELVKTIGMGDRNAEQLRLMYHYKYMKSKKEGYDIGKERAFNEFISLYGKKFDEVYKDGMKNGELFEKVFGFKREHTDEDIRQHLSK